MADVDLSVTAPDTVASSSLDGIVNLGDLRKPGKPASTLYADGDSVRAVRLSPTESNLLASTHGHRWRVWDRRKPTVPLCTVHAHSHTVKDLRWHARNREALMTCSTDKTVKFWNFSRAVNQPETADADEALDRVLQTGTALSNIHPISHSEAVVGYGDEIALLDCRVRRISDRKAKIEPIRSWPLRRSRAVGLRTSEQGIVQSLTLFEGDLHFADIGLQLLKETGIDDTASVAAKTRHEDEGVLANLKDGWRIKHMPMRKPHRRLSDFGGLLGRKADPPERTVNTSTAGRHERSVHQAETVEDEIASE